MVYLLTKNAYPTYSEKRRDYFFSKQFTKYFRPKIFVKFDNNTNTVVCQLSFPASSSVDYRRPNCRCCLCLEQTRVEMGNICCPNPIQSNAWMNPIHVQLRNKLPCHVKSPPSLLVFWRLDTSTTCFQTICSAMWSDCCHYQTRRMSFNHLRSSFFSRCFRTAEHSAAECHVDTVWLLLENAWRVIASLVTPRTKLHKVRQKVARRAGQLSLPHVINN